MRRRKKDVYETAFDTVNQQMDTDLSTDGFSEVIGIMETAEVPIDTYVKEFEYAYALNSTKGCFDQEDLTLVGLFDIKAISTLTEDTPDYTFVWKLATLAAIAVVCYVAGAVRFCEKDLPL